MVRNRHNKRARVRVSAPTVVTPRSSNSGLARISARAKASSMSLPMSVSRISDGRVQWKNNWRPTPDNFGRPQVSIERCRPGRGHRHVLRCADVYTFIHLLPAWDELSGSLNRILLAPGSETSLGWFRRGTVAV